jgi:hypothetical protein
MMMDRRPVPCTDHGRRFPSDLSTVDSTLVGRSLPQLPASTQRDVHDVRDGRGYGIHDG